jgi:hypothetical protein
LFIWGESHIRQRPCVKYMTSIFKHFPSQGTWKCPQSARRSFQVEFWLAKNLLLTLHGHNLFLHQTNKFPWQKKVIIYSLGKGVCRCRQQKYYIKSIFIDAVNTHSSSFLQLCLIMLNQNTHIYIESLVKYVVSVIDCNISLFRTASRSNYAYFD